MGKKACFFEKIVRHGNRRFNKKWYLCNLKTALMDDDFKTAYGDTPLFPESDSFSGRAGGGSWDYVAPEQLPGRPAWSAGSSGGVVPQGGSEAHGGMTESVGQVPEPLMQLQAMMTRDHWTFTQNRAFYNEAKLMADYADHAPIVPFHCYFPTYHSMTVAQLRSYFTVRHLLRQGKYPDVPLSYLFVYVYELLMKIGCDNAEEAYELLQELRANYTTEPSLSRYLRLWSRDFVVYNNLTGHIAEQFDAERQEDAEALVLVNRNTVSDRLLFQTVTSLSAYNLTGGALYKKQREAVEAVVPRVIRGVAGLLEKVTHHRLETLCMGMRRQVAHPMFEAAIFYDPAPVREREVAISLRRKYVCHSGIWTETMYSQRLSNHRGGPLGAILRETDRRLRLSLRVGPRIAPRPLDKEIQNAVQQIINDWMAERAEAQRPKVTVDFSKLDRIRTDAAAVRDALLTDEDREETASVSTAVSPEPLETTVAKKPTAPSAPTAVPGRPEKEQAAASLFTSEEQAFLRLLLKGGDWQACLRSFHTPLGVMVDGVNSKAMDWLGDVLIEDDGEGPKLIEDYLEDVENELNK